ncbi:MAG TPA: S1C family serine protease [Candidatus Paceibacterota bacterium]
MFVKRLAVAAIFALSSLGCSTLNSSRPSVQDRLRPNIAQRDKTPAEIYAEADYLAYIELDIEVTDTEGNVEERKGWLSGALIYRASEYYILTAGHITQTGGKIIKISAYLKNGVGPEEVEILGVDKDLDAAILKFKNPYFTFSGRVARLGNSSKLRVGEQVVALGTPLGIRDALSVGWVMSLLSDDPRFTQSSLIIHQAPINRGNSGGPLLNMRGEVVGINVMFLYDNRVWVSYPMSIAVPIDDIKRILPELISGNKRVNN